MSKQTKNQTILDDIINAFAKFIGDSIFWLISFCAKQLMKQFGKKENRNPAVIKPEFLNRKVKVTNPFGVAYSYKFECDIDFRYVDLNRHTLICGATGAGKSVTLETIMFARVLKDKIKIGMPVIFIDPKGDIDALKKFKALNENQGKKCYIFSEVWPDSDKCNPVLDGSTSAILNRLFTIFEWGEPYYADTNYIALEKAIMALKSNGLPVTIDALHEYISTNLESKVTINIINKLSKIKNSEFGRLLSAKEDAVTFSRIREEGASIYIGLSTLGFPETSSMIGKLFVYELMYHSYEVLADFSNTKNVNTSLSVFIDELGSVITPDFISLINKCRGAGIGVTVAFQTLADLNHIGEQFRDQLIGNMNNFFIGHTHVSSEAEYWAGLNSTVESMKETRMIDGDEEMEKGSRRNVQEYLVHPSVFKELSVGEFVIRSFFPQKYVDLVKIHQIPFAVKKVTPIHATKVISKPENVAPENKRNLVKRRKYERTSDK
jgi:hypothetical protein